MLYKNGKSAQANLENAQQTYRRNHAVCEEIADVMKGKFAARNDVRLEAKVALVAAENFLKQSNPANRGKTENIGVTPDQIPDSQNRFEIAEQILKTIGVVGVSASVGAAAAPGAWALASMGTASTGAAISGLNGAVVTTAKLAWLGRTVATVGITGISGMTLGTAALASLPVLPAVVAFGIMARRNAKKNKEFEEWADKECEKIAAAEHELTRWRQTANLATRRTNELANATKELTSSLRQLLAQCSPNNPADVKTVASISGDLAQVFDIPVTDEHGNLITEDALKNAYRRHLLRTRRQELSKAYDRLHEAIATKGHDRAVSTANHILSVITL